MVRETSSAERRRRMRSAWGRKLSVVRMAAVKPSVSSSRDPGCMMGPRFQEWWESVRRARALSVSQLFDPIPAHGVVHRRPGEPRPLDLGFLIGFERTMPFLAAAGGG